MSDLDALEQELLMRITRYVHATVCFNVDMACSGMYQASHIPSYSEALYQAYKDDPVFAENVFAKHNLGVFDDFTLAMNEVRARFERECLLSCTADSKALKRPCWL